MSLLHINNLIIELGSVGLLEAKKLVIDEGDIIGLTGNNGTGKTSLLKMLVGKITYSGEKLVIPLLHTRS